MKRFFAVAAISSVCLISGCSTDSLPGYLKPYRPDVHQGNVVTSEMLESLHEGMTKNQVIFLLGTPTLISSFHKNEWDYIYYLNPRIGETQIRKLQVYFDEDGRVESFKADKMPDETDADLMILGERARESSIKRNEDMKKEKEAAADSSAQAQPVIQEQDSSVSSTDKEAQQ
ncbi:MAG: outer membrane protein assembly factor BamE [Burkholderiales bacterium]|uniref:outer membrane protein assembly factor BamE n=1 Tax=uncultured Turicimonas sp. TaxID=1918607 RepID=UPI001ED1A7B1|nr:outer membrane protein assembly factor BamE [uncultured Turicimonas sp.]MBS4846020.1 outer membrane protein assembly factor BamE [Burkholderiales bacterium]